MEMSNFADVQATACEVFSLTERLKVDNRVTFYSSPSPAAEITFLKNTVVWKTQGLVGNWGGEGSAPPLALVDAILNINRSKADHNIYRIIGT
jgi:hypothetical protein